MHLAYLSLGSCIASAILFDLHLCLDWCIFPHEPSLINIGLVLEDTVVVPIIDVLEKRKYLLDLS